MKDHIVAKGQIWLRKSMDQYIIVVGYLGRHQWNIRCIAGIDVFFGNSTIGDDWFLDHCTRFHPVLCIRCGTARARLTPAGRQYAKGLLCWSCNG